MDQAGTGTGFCEGLKLRTAHCSSRAHSADVEGGMGSRPWIHRFVAGQNSSLCMHLRLPVSLGVERRKCKFVGWEIKAVQSMHVALRWHACQSCLRLRSWAKGS